MEMPRRTLTLLYILFFVMIAYLVIGTGLVSDDFSHVRALEHKTASETVLMRDPSWLLLPAEHYLLLAWYRLVTIDRCGVLVLLKIVYLCLSFWLIGRFFSLYLDRATACLASFLFIFFPAHDATAYWFLAYYLTISFAFYLYAFYLLRRGRPVAGVCFAFLASFVSYGSTPVAAGLACIFLLDKEYRKAALILTPNILFIAFYAVMTHYILPGSNKVAASVGAGSFVKQYLLQLATFADAMLGPSMWLKIYYAFFQMTFVAFAVGVTLLLVVYRFCAARPASRYNLPLITGLAVMMLLAFGVFAVTGKYPQLAFNLGNRVTIFGSLLAAYLIAAAPLPKAARGALFTVLIFAIMGISCHWKAWDTHQRVVLAKIRHNTALARYAGPGPVYVSGNQYSRFGTIGHIEFFTEAATTMPFFSLALPDKKGFVVWPLNRRFVYRSGALIDTKHGFAQPVGRAITVYDSEKDVVREIPAGAINAYIATLPKDIRHWSQLIRYPWIDRAALRLMPRLRYAYQ